MQQKDLSDEAIARAVCVKVGDSPGVSYSDIAAKAYECGRAELAIKVSQASQSISREELGTLEHGCGGSTLVPFWSMLVLVGSPCSCLILRLGLESRSLCC